ncbi:MAG TPA: hypothetical protein ENI85_06125, partial [Deltaproteobacteria bacterium]|nr:hypothetical protein [Deltaproteobacteria bacterium]
MGEHVEYRFRATDGVRSFGDRRHASRRATDRRRAAEDALLDALLLPHDTSAGGISSQGQTLLARALARLERQEGVASAVAWAVEPGSPPEAGPKVLAAHPSHAARRIPPTRELYDAIVERERVQRLTDPGLGIELSALAARGVAAVAPIMSHGTTPAAALLVFARRPGRSLRPRTIAVLEDVARKLARTLSTRLALDRLGRLDEAVQQLDRLAALGRLVSEIVHEVRNPLVSVKTFLQLLPERLDDPEFHRDFREVVSDEVQRLERMLDDLLHHARPRSTAGFDQGARVSEVARTTLQLLAYRCRERGVGLDVRIEPDLPALALAEDALRQLLLNLLLNATAVTPEGGQIVLSAGWSPALANHLELKVEDDGPGLDESLRSKIFEPFWTTRNEEAGGLGLAICKRIVEEAAGTIEVHN